MDGNLLNEQINI